MSGMKEKKTKKVQKIKPRSGLYRVIRGLLGAPIRFFTRIHVKGWENEPPAEEGACLIICNHLTWRDPIMLCAVLKHHQPHFMGKKELFRIPVLSQLLRALGAYPVDRGGADVGAIRYTISLLKDDVPVGMFPQGHRYNGQDPRKTDVKKGAAMIATKAGVPVLPMYIKVKGNRARLFCRKEIIIGKPITVAEMAYDPEASGEYERITKLLFERVCALGDED